MTRHHYTAEELDSWNRWFDALDKTGPYHSPKYLTLLAGEYEDESEEAELYVYGDEDAFIYYPYICRNIDGLPFVDAALGDPDRYSDIISSWYWGGPLLSPGADESLATEFLDAFNEHCAASGIISEFLRFDPNVENYKTFPELDPEFDRKTVTIDLNQTKQEIWDGYEGRNQRAIKQARESDLRIEPSDDVEDIRSFHRIYASAMDARDASEHYRFSQSFFEQLLASELFSFIVAKHKDDVVGGFIIAHDDWVGHHYLSASDPEYWDDRVNNLMYHRAVMHMHESGRGLFDFQGGRPGVYKFKKGFSTEGRGEFYIANRVHLPEQYEALVAAADEFGIDTSTDYFPVYREKKTN